MYAALLSLFGCLLFLLFGLWAASIFCVCVYLPCQMRGAFVEMGAQLEGYPVAAGFRGLGFRGSGV